ncbi:MAG: hypothetical protein IPJ19_14060 [Planctomycetes bacterium]|nr:hypothetical protein [Planctomycetota bacterium]
MSYVHVWAGGEHTLSLRSDGELIAFGNNNHGQCNVPALPPGTSWLDAAAGDFNSRAAQRPQRSRLGLGAARPHASPGDLLRFPLIR